MITSINLCVMIVIIVYYLAIALKLMWEMFPRLFTCFHFSVAQWCQVTYALHHQWLSLVWSAWRHSLATCIHHAGLIRYSGDDDRHSTSHSCWRPLNIFSRYTLQLYHKSQSIYHIYGGLYVITFLIFLSA